MCITYLGDMMQDNQALSHKDMLPMRIKIQRKPETNIGTTKTTNEKRKRKKKTKDPENKTPRKENKSQKYTKTNHTI